MTISWLSPDMLVEYELRELEESGLDIADERRQWEHLREKTGDELLDASIHLLKSLEGRSAGSIASPHEPHDLDEILQAGEQGLTLPSAISESLIADRIHAGWLGRAAGCLLGKPVEKTQRKGIREILESNGTWPLTAYITERGIPSALLTKYPWNKHSGRESLRENILCMPEDDDLNYSIVNLSVLEKAGWEFSTDQIAQAWLSLLPVLSTFTAERAAYRNLLQGYVAPTTAMHHNPYREWIGAQIRGDVFGWVVPGRPESAARLAYRDARLSHVRNGIYGEMFVAGMIAAAMVIDDPREVIRRGLRFLPRTSRLAEAVRFALTLPASESTWDGAVDRLYERFGKYHWVHSINNAALVACALLYGNGDFSRSICYAVMGGWDTDSNGATVGSVTGTMLGRIPESWAAPLRDTIRSSIMGFDRSTIRGLAERTATIANRFARA